MVSKFELINGKLRAFTSLGGYPMFYLDGQDSCLCADCATESYLDDDELPSFKPKYADVNWEDECLYCDRCSEQIESAYGENS